MANIIFDFDGTIADSFGVVVRIAADLTDSHEALKPAEVERLRGMSLLHIARELKIKPWKVPFLLARGRRRMRREMSKVQVFQGMPETIKTLYGEGHKLYIMSSNSVQNIHLFLHRHDMLNEFIKVYGGVGLFGKARVLKKLLRQNGLDAAGTIYVGDEVRDIEAAKRAGVRILSVGWGYNTPEILSRHEPDVLAEKPADIIGAIASR